MSDWKKSLDRYLTQEPPDDSWWFEKCAELIPDRTWELILTQDHKKEIKFSDAIDKWMDRLYDKGYTPERASQIIIYAIKMRLGI